jgi:hypothetical protein
MAGAPMSSSRLQLLAGNVIPDFRASIMSRGGKSCIDRVSVVQRWPVLAIEHYQALVERATIPEYIVQQAIIRETIKVVRFERVSNVDESAKVSVTKVLNAQKPAPTASRPNDHGVWIYVDEQRSWAGVSQIIASQWWLKRWVGDPRRGGLALSARLVTPECIERSCFIQGLIQYGKRTVTISPVGQRVRQQDIDARSHAMSIRQTEHFMRMSEMPSKLPV